MENKEQPVNKKVSLVLASGGARGVAHIGVIEELLRQGYEIQSIAGASMGALVGGLYAAGKLDEGKEILCNLDKKGILALADFSISSKGIVKGDKVVKELERILNGVTIEELSIPYIAVATDIINNKERVFDKGSLSHAIRASISIPAVFQPFEIDGIEYVDGGVLNPIPINRIKRPGNDILVAVDVNGAISKTEIAKEDKPFSIKHLWEQESLFFLTDKQINYVSLLLQSCRLMIQKISEMSVEKYQPDIVITLPINSYMPFQFDKSKEIIEVGKSLTIEALDKYRNAIEIR